MLLLSKLDTTLHFVEAVVALHAWFLEVFIHIPLED